MWGNAVRHKEAFRRDKGRELTRPMTTALFTCLVHPNSTDGRTSIKDVPLKSDEIVYAIELRDTVRGPESMRDCLKSWGIA